MDTQTTTELILLFGGFVVGCIVGGAFMAVRSFEFAQTPLENVSSCPECGSDAVTWDSMETEEGVAVQGATCDVCNTEWTDVYSLLRQDIVPGTR